VNVKGIVTFYNEEPDDSGHSPQRPEAHVGRVEIEGADVREVLEQAAALTDNTDAPHYTIDLDTV